VPKRFGAYLAFGLMMLNKGWHGNEQILSRPASELMTVDHLAVAQKSNNELIFGTHSGWGVRCDRQLET
jgi:hypothetical protein